METFTSTLKHLDRKTVQLIFRSYMFHVTKHNYYIQRTFYFAFQILFKDSFILNFHAE